MLTSLSCTESIIHASAKPRQCLSSLQSSSGPASRARSAAPSSGEPAGGRQQRSGAPGGERRALARAPARAGALEPPAASVGKALGDPPEAGLQKAVAGEALPRRRLAAQLSASSRSSSLCLAAAAHKRGSGESAAAAPARRAAEVAQPAGCPPSACGRFLQPGRPPADVAGVAGFTGDSTGVAAVLHEPLRDAAGKAVCGGNAPGDPAWVRCGGAPRGETTATQKRATGEAPSSSAHHTSSSSEEAAGSLRAAGLSMEARPSATTGATALLLHRLDALLIKAR